MSSIKIDGNKIRKLREEKELTQLYLATFVEVTTDTISRWENRRYPSIKRENAEKLAQALEVNLDQLLEEEAVDEETKSQDLKPEDTILTRKTKSTRSKSSWLVWMGLALAVVAGIVCYFLLAKTTSELSAVRILPSHTAPGQPFPVVIAVKGSTELPVLIREQIQGRATASSVASSQEVGKTFGQTPRWIGKMAGEHLRFVYLVQPEQLVRSNDTIDFSGDLTVREDKQQEIAISGPDQVRISIYHWADSDRDSTISDNEILLAYELFGSPDNQGLDFSHLEELWLQGGYRWDPSSLSFTQATTQTIKETQ